MKTVLRYLPSVVSVVAAGVLLIAWTPQAVGQITAVWNGPGLGEWDVAGNWDVGIVPANPGDTAILGDTPLSTQIVNLGTDILISELLFDNVSTNYTIQGPASFITSPPALMQTIALSKNGSGRVEFSDMLGFENLHAFGGINVSDGELALIDGADAVVNNLSLTGSSNVTIQSMGHLSVGPGSTLQMQGAGAELDVLGDLTVDGGAILLNGQLNFNDLNVNTGGSLTVAGGGSLEILGATGGQLTVNPGGSLVIQGPLSTLSAPTIQLGGELSGTGTINSNITNNSRVAPGDLGGTTPGRLSVTGNYTQAATAVLGVQVDGVNPGEFDVLEVNGGTADLAGTLQIDVSNFARVPGTVPHLTVLEGVVAGQFDTIEVLGNNALEFFVSYNSVTITGCAKGDMDCDGFFTASDVPMFAEALSNPDAYEASLLASFVSQSLTVSPSALVDAANILGDVDALNNSIDFDDIDEFANLIPGVSAGQVLAYLNGTPLVPEPSAGGLVLILSGLLSIASRPARRAGRVSA